MGKIAVKKSIFYSSSSWFYFNVLIFFNHCQPKDFNWGSLQCCKLIFISSGYLQHWVLGSEISIYLVFFNCCSLKLLRASCLFAIHKFFSSFKFTLVPLFLLFMLLFSIFLHCLLYLQPCLFFIFYPTPSN